MATLNDEPMSGLRVLIVSDPGGGKTGSVLKLAESGQKVFVADFDDNLFRLRKFISPDAFKSIHYETLVDKVSFNAEGLPVVDGIPKAWSGFCKLCKTWVDRNTGEDFGEPESWGPDCWFVIDSLTSMGNASMYYTKFRRKSMGKRRSKPDWGDAIERVEGALQIFAGSPVNFICTAHLARLNMEDITENTDDSGNVIAKPTASLRLPPNANMRYPTALGQKLPPRVGGYFNLILQAQRIGSGVGARRVLRTVPEEDVDIKVPLPARTLPPEVPIDKLWTILSALR